jgi:hypothetical protein
VKIGDLVRHTNYCLEDNMIGVILDKINHVKAINNDVFNVLWAGGSVGENVWDYDLVVLDESR